MQQKITRPILLFIFLTALSFAQKPGSSNNLIMIQGDDYKDGVSGELTCTGKCFTVDNSTKSISFTLTGKLGEKNISVYCDVPILSGTKKIKVDKDGDAKLHQKLTIEIYGSNPAVDKDQYEIQDLSDEAIITIMKLDEKTGFLEGTFSCKYFDSSTGIKRLAATCHFKIQQP